MNPERKRILCRDAGIFLLSIALRWAVEVLGFVLLHKGLSGFWQQLTDYLIQAGDAPHYLQIAAHGYASAGDTVNNIVFYPLYPLLTRGLSYLTGSVVSAAMLLSNVCLGASGAVLFRLFGVLSGEEGGRRAWEALLFFLCTPFGMFFTGIYTESLFVLLCALTLLLLYRGRWGAMAAAGFLAALTRAQGVVLLLPAVCEAVLRRKQDRRGTGRHLLLTLLIPLGTVCYLLLNLAVTGNAFAFVEYEAAPPWFNTTQWISVNLQNQLNMALDNAYLGAVIYWPQIVLYFLGVAAIAAGLYLGERTSWLAFGGAYICVSYLHGWLISGARYMLCCLPLYLLATRLKPAARYAVLAGSAALGLAYMVMYLSGGAIM